MSDPAVVFVADGEVRAHPTDLFPGTTPDDWSAHAGLLDGTGRLVFPVGSFLVRRGDLVALVDLGLGESHVDTPTGASYRGGRLLDNLAVLGVPPERVDLVVYTHLHRDHVGWTAGSGGLTFAGARHVVHRAEWDHWQDHDSAVGPGHATVLDPLCDVVEFCADGDELADGVHVVATPGHTPGHQSVVVDLGGDRVVVAGDVLHSPAQLAHPDWCFGSDHDPARASASRRLLLDRYGPDVLACGHFPRGSVGVSWP